VDFRCGFRTLAIIIFEGVVLNMELTVLGSGTYIPELNRHCASYLLKVGSQNLVFDFGRGTVGQLLKEGINYYDIDAIFITHTHADHCSELSSFLQIALEGPPLENLRNKDLKIYGPVGIDKMVHNIMSAFGIVDNTVKFKTEIKELKDGECVEGEDWKVKLLEVEHKPSRVCSAYRVESENKVFAYSGDTEDCDGLRNACKEADLAIIETNNTNDKEKQGHMTGKLTGKVAQESNVKKLVVTHVSPDYLENVLEDVKKEYKGSVVLAEDMMKIVI